MNRYRIEWWDEDARSWRDTGDVLVAIDQAEANYYANCYGRSNGAECRAVLSRV